MPDLPDPLPEEQPSIAPTPAPTASSDPSPPPRARGRPPGRKTDPNKLPKEMRKIRTLGLLLEHLRTHGEGLSLSEIHRLAGTDMGTIVRTRRRLLDIAGAEAGERGRGVNWETVTEEGIQRIEENVRLRSEEEREKQGKILTDEEMERVLSKLAESEIPGIQVQAVKALNDLRSRRRPQELAQMTVPRTDMEKAERLQVLLECVGPRVRGLLWKSFRKEIHTHGDPAI